MYKAIEDILPRNQTKVKNELEKLSSAIDSAVDFGTHLLKWQADKMQHGDEHLVPILFFRNILELADSISILIRNSSVDPAKTLLRSLLENSFGLEYLIERDKKKRALSYNVWVAHKNLKLYEKLNRNSQAGKQFSGEIRKDSHIKELRNNESKIAQEKGNLEELLRLPLYQPIEDEYQRTHRIRKNPKWFSLYDGPNDVEQLAKRLNHHAIYEIVYRNLSDNVHATDVMKSKLLSNTNGSTGIIQIRFPKDAQSITNNTLNFLLMAYIEFYKKELPNKENDVAKWYSEFRVVYREVRDKELFNIKL